MVIDANGLHFQALNRQIRETADAQIVIEHCCGQRYIASGLSGKTIDIHGIPGNALGAYLDSGRIFVHGNAQDAVGDTMNDGEICIDGMAGDAAGYAMRGGRILIRGDVGYRAGIHMKAYRDKQPVMVIGGEAGSFLGEYQAGGTIVVLGCTPPAAAHRWVTFAAWGCTAEKSCCAPPPCRWIFPSGCSPGGRKKRIWRNSVPPSTPSARRSVRIRAAS